MKEGECAEKKEQGLSFQISLCISPKPFYVLERFASPTLTTRW